MLRLRLLGLALLLALNGCPAGPDPIFPDDWETALTEVRDCRRSIDHDLEFVRLLVSPEWVDHYQTCVVPSGTCTEPFGVGALFVKPQYMDDACTELLRISASVREIEVTEPGFEGWHWQEATPGGTVTENGQPRECTSCHSTCDDNFDFRCAMDP